MGNEKKCGGKIYENIFIFSSLQGDEEWDFILLRLLVSFHLQFSMLEFIKTFYDSTHLIWCWILTTRVHSWKEEEGRRVAKSEIEDLAWWNEDGERHSGTGTALKTRFTSTRYKASIQNKWEGKEANDVILKFKKS